MPCLLEDSNPQSAHRKPLPGLLDLRGSGDACAGKRFDNCLMGMPPRPVFHGPTLSHGQSGDKPTRRSTPRAMAPKANGRSVDQSGVPVGLVDRRPERGVFADTMAFSVKDTTKQARNASDAQTTTQNETLARPNPTTKEERIVSSVVFSPGGD